ncbi:hypothetical protein EPN83_02545 [Patescibacteria group bacterium]|nr:MAG: hypothetical protein EPN83_02545 [Patescibacteria group bacterium]
MKHHGEWYPGNFVPILSATLFESVQEVLRRKSRPRKSKKRHDFPFTGLLTCGECGCAISAQFARGHGGIYRYYRCTKRKGKCSQSYVQETALAAQLKTRIQSVAMRDLWIKEMLRQVDEWEKEGVHKSRSFVQNLDSKLRETQEKLDKLVSAYIDGDIPKDIYLAKKDELMRRKASITGQKEDFGRTGKNWNEPLRSWILDIQKAEKLSQSDNFPEIKGFVQKIGTNHQLLDKSAFFSFRPPWDFAALRLAQSGPAEPRSGEATSLSESERLILSAQQDSNLQPTA